MTEKTIAKTEVVQEQSTSIVDLASKIGLGIWDRLKYRLNIEGVKESIETSKERFLNSSEEEGNSALKNG